MRSRDGWFRVRINCCPGALRDDHLGLRLVRIAADAGLAALHFEYAEVAELDVTTIGQRLLDDVERQLDGFDDLLLGEVRLFVDIENDFAFCEVSGHRVPWLEAFLRDWKLLLEFRLGQSSERFLS